MKRLRSLGRTAWLIVAVVILDVLWLSAMGNALDSCEKELDDLFGVAIGSCSLNWTPFLFVNALVIGLLVVWHVSRRSCPVCATKANRGVTVCRTCGYDFAQAASGTVRAPASRPPMPAALAPSGAPVDEIEWLDRDERYLLGRTLTTPYYGIWDREAPGPPIHKFPYTEYGKSEAADRLADLRSSEPATETPQ